jgi:hypothetical protein
LSISGMFLQIILVCSSLAIGPMIVLNIYTYINSRRIKNRYEKEKAEAIDRDEEEPEEPEEKEVQVSQYLFIVILGIMLYSMLFTVFKVSGGGKASLGGSELTNLIAKNVMENRAIIGNDFPVLGKPIHDITLNTTQYEWFNMNRGEYKLSLIPYPEGAFDDDEPFTPNVDNGIHSCLTVRPTKSLIDLTQKNDRHLSRMINEENDLLRIITATRADIDRAKSSSAAETVRVTSLSKMAGTVVGGGVALASTLFTPVTVPTVIAGAAVGAVSAGELTGAVRSYNQAANPEDYELGKLQIELEGYLRQGEQLKIDKDISEAYQKMLEALINLRTVDCNNFVAEVNNMKKLISSYEYSYVNGWRMFCLTLGAGIINHLSKTKLRITEGTPGEEILFDPEGSGDTLSRFQEMLQTLLTKQQDLGNELKEKENLLIQERKEAAKAEAEQRMERAEAAADVLETMRQERERQIEQSNMEAKEKVNEYFESLTENVKEAPEKLDQSVSNFKDFLLSGIDSDTVIDSTALPGIVKSGVQSVSKSVKRGAEYTSNIPQYILDRYSQWKAKSNRPQSEQLDSIMNRLSRTTSNPI